MESMAMVIMYIGVASRSCCKELYRNPHINY